ncbi:MAG: D-2-hydroxyacid dehydrogenase [Verrucomicrobiia bacterium]
MTPLTIWCNATLKNSATQLLTQSLGEHRLLLSQHHAATVVEATPADANFYQAQILFGQPDPDAVLKTTQLRWIHLSTASYTRYDNPTFKKFLRDNHILFTNSSHVYSEPCAQHVLAMMLSLNRQLPAAHENQRGAHGWPFHPIRANSHLLNGQIVLFLGFGAIPKRLVELLTPLHVKFIALKRNAMTYPSITFTTLENLPFALKQADHVINALPDSASTYHFMNTDRFSQMKKGARFYNIGRGPTVNQEALMHALKSDHLNAAFIDVTEPEPLPPDHPLWQTPNLFITPHTGGGHSNEEERLVEHFTNHLRAFETSRPLQDIVPLI